MIMKTQLTIESIFCNPAWESVQDALTKMTKLAIVVINSKGIPVTRHTGRTKFCSLVRADKRLREYCYKCDARAGFEAMINQQPFVYKCYFSLVDMAFPIIINGQYVGALMAGQVKLPKKVYDTLEYCYKPTNQRLVQKAKREWREYYTQMPEITIEQYENNRLLLSELCKYIQDFLGSKMESYEQDGAGDKVVYHEESTEELYADDDLTHVLVNYYGNSFFFFHDVTKKALKYLFTHKNTRITRSDMAKHCNVSSAYLSNLFLRDLHASYSEYVIGLKIEWGKAMLESSMLPVAAVSENLGFSDTSYFIRVFKQQTGITPLKYRKSVIDMNSSR